MNDAGELGIEVDRRLLSDQVYTHLRKGIVAGELEPGTRLVELELARRYHVSQAPVREALNRLAAEGLVLQLRRRGSYVADISKKDARDAYTVRALLEEHAARLVCAAADEAVFGQLDALIEAMHVASQRRDVSSFVEADVTFHRTVWDHSGNGLLPRIWPLAETSFRSLTAISNRVYYRDLREIAQTHVPLVAALRSNDPAVAGAAFRGHVEAVWLLAGDGPDSAVTPPTNP